MSSPRSAPQHGFTLLEVLVAVAILGLVVSMLAGAAMQGMAYEGDGMRRTRASLLADRALWQIEAGLKLGTLPEVGRQESDVDETFHVSVDVQPIVAGPGGLAALLAPSAEPTERDDSQSAPAGASTLALLQVQVRVSWIEGVREQEVTRSTFAYDASAAAEALGAGDPDDEEESADDEEDEDL